MTVKRPSGLEDWDSLGRFLRCCSADFGLRYPYPPTLIITSMPRNLTTALNSVPEEHVELLVDHVEGEHADPSVLVLPSRGSEPVCAMFSLVLCPFPKKQEY